MNLHNPFSLPSFIGTLILFGQLPASAQHGDRPKEMYLPMQVEVTANGEDAGQYSVTLFKDNERVTELPPSAESAFELGLDLDSRYTVQVEKPGYRTKLISIDTHLPAGVVKYKPYPCLIDLEPQDKFAHSDPFYLDFPSALVRWDATKGAFDHSDPYLADIQLKVALLGAQVDTE